MRTPQPETGLPMESLLRWIRKCETFTSVMRMVRSRFCLRRMFKSDYNPVSSGEALKKERWNLRWEGRGFPLICPRICTSNELSRMRKPSGNGRNGAEGQSSMESFTWNPSQTICLVLGNHGFRGNSWVKTVVLWMCKSGRKSFRSARRVMMDNTGSWDCSAGRI